MQSSAIKIRAELQQHFQQSPHCILPEIFTCKGIGTMVTKEKVLCHSNEQLREKIITSRANNTRLVAILPKSYKLLFA